MIRKGLFLFLFPAIAYFAPTYGQSWSEISNNNRAYLHGHGYGETVDEADRKALADLISQISVEISSSMTITEDEVEHNNTFDYKAYTNSKIQTYSDATLTNAERIIIKNEPDAEVGRYIKRSEIGRLFEGRKRKINEYMRLGTEAEEKAKLDDALRCYYWAYTLAKTLQYPNEFKDNNDRLLMVWLPQHLNDIFTDIHTDVVDVHDGYIDLTFTFRGKPVTSLDYSYFDGATWTSLMSVKDGRGVLEFGSEIPSTIQMRFEYAYKGQSMIDMEVDRVLKTVNSHLMRKCYYDLPFKRASTRASNAVYGVATREAISSTAALEQASADKATSVKNILDAVAQAVKTHQYPDAETYFTEEGKEMYRALITYGNARILNYNNNETTVTKYGNRYIARSIPMVFTFKKGVRKSFVEDVVFTFNEEGLIESLAFSLEADALKDIAAKTVWPAETRQIIINFLENYKTAYALKRLEYLRAIFDDNALIIVGSTVQRQRSDSDISQRHELVRYNRMTKEQYIKNLERCFKSKEYINIRFANNNIVRGGEHMGETYGIQIKQDYYSSNYGDQGYLYLQVDMNNPDKPIITVRTWQPQPDPNLGIYDISSF